jgi:serine protease AprX
MTDSLRIRWGMWNASAVALAAAVCVLATLTLATAKVTGVGSATPSADTAKASPALLELAHGHPIQRVEAIVQLERGTNPAAGKSLVAQLGGRTTGELPIINGLAARMSAQSAAKLADKPGVRNVSLNAAVKKTGIVSGIDTSLLQTSYPDSVQAPKAWASSTGKGVGVAVVDTGIAGTLPDFRVSQSDSSSRVVATAATNPYATSDNDSYGHGTHVAGIIAGNGGNRPSSDSLDGDYVGVAPNANLVSVKVSDEKGDATVLDVIYGLQFVVDYKSTYNIRVVNLSLESAQPQSYKTDPLDAAAEAVWFNGIAVVAAAGNRGTDDDAVDYAPGNDPYVISVGGVDDQGTKNTLDDAIASWSSRGTTQDGYAKPDVLAPGAHIVSNLAPNSAFASLCPSCIVSGQYIRVGGTSMAAPMVSGAVADMLQLRPNLTPDQVKAAIVGGGRKVLGTSTSEVSANDLVYGGIPTTNPNQGLTPNSMINASTGQIDYSRSTWSRSTWSRSTWSRSTWSRSTWSCNCSKTSSGTIDPTRSTWSRSTWSTSWTK